MLCLMENMTELFPQYINKVYCASYGQVYYVFPLVTTERLAVLPLLCWQTYSASLKKVISNIT